MNSAQTNPAGIPLTPSKEAVDFLIKMQDHYGGCGGTSIGMMATGGIEVVAMLNHNANAVATHALNHPHTKHFCADVRTTNEYDLGFADMIWASPSCTHHSIARGGMSCDAQERALPEELPRFGFSSNANCIMVENVKEFRSWGPIEHKRDAQGKKVYKQGKNGKPEAVYVPIKKRKGEFYNSWVATLKSMGYVNYEWRILNAADFGTPQSRKRYFGIFTRPGMPITWPQATHDIEGRNGLPRWRAVRECLDLNDHGHSIFTRVERGKKALTDATLRRLMAGLKKEVLEKGQSAYLSKYNSNSASGKPSRSPGLDEASPTAACQQRIALVQVKPMHYLFNSAWGGASRSVHRAGPVIVARQDKAPLRAVQVNFLRPSRTFLTHYYTGRGQSSATCRPCSTVMVNPKAGLVQVQFMSGQYGKGQTTSTQQPNPPLLQVPKQNLVTTHLLYQNNGTRANDHAGRVTRPVCNPAPTATTNGGNLFQLTVQRLYSNYGTRATSEASRTFRLDLTARTATATGGQQYLMTYYKHGAVRPVAQVSPTLRTKDCAAQVTLRYFTFNHQFNNLPNSINDPARTVLCSRRHPYLATIVPGLVHLLEKVYDSDVMRELKRICRENGIADILMRMLKVQELKLIMGFPADYQLLGNDTQQKAMLGNAVCPQVAEAMGRAMLPILRAARGRQHKPLKLGVVERWEQGVLFA